MPFPRDYKMKHFLKKRLQELLEEGADYARALVSTPKVAGVRTPIGGPPHLRTGDLMRHITTRVFDEGGRKVIGYLWSTAVHRGAPYPFILEDEFDTPQGETVGPYPWMAFTAAHMRRNARKVLGRSPTAVEWGALIGTTKTEKSQVTLLRIH